MRHLTHEMTMYEVVLINPPSPWLISDTDVPPLGLLYIARALKNADISYTVCDLAGLKEDQWKIPVGEVYGITGTSPHFNIMNRITDIIKARPIASRVVWGGPHATLMPEHVLNNTQCDLCIIGEGEYSFINWLEYGISCQHNHSTRIIDLYSMPDRNSIDIFKYSKAKTSKYIMGDCRETTIFTSRGCPYNCSFCAQKNIWGGKVIYRDIDRIRDELLYLKTIYRINLIWIMDDTFILNRYLVKAVCKEMREFDLSWHCLSRVDTIDDEIVKLMADSGCKQIMFGFESGSNYMLDLMNKKFTVQQSLKAIDIVKKYGIKIRGQMIVGFPGENEETIEETAKFIQGADIDAFGIHIFQPFPGSDVWNNPKKYDYKLDKEAAIKSGFSTFHTIGKPGEIPTEDNQIKKWFRYLREVADKKNVHNMGAQDD